MINSRRIVDLLPRTQVKAISFRDGCAAAGHPVLITCTLRDTEYQNSLYERGRTLPGKRVTNAKGGDSLHQYRVAFDFVPLVDGAPEWGNDALWAKCGAIAQSVGLEWGGAWKSFVDRPHCQDLNGLTLDDYKAGKS